MTSRDVDLSPDVQLDPKKLLGFKRIAAFSNDGVELIKALDVTFNKAGGETPPPARHR
jgi:hypothetical protein